MKKTQENSQINIFLRYMILIILVNFFLTDIFVEFMIKIFLYTSYFFLKLFTYVEILAGELLLPGSQRFIIVRECIAPSAYLLISIVILTVPLKSIKRNLSILIKSIILFSIFNLIRILLLMWIHVTFGVYYFEKLHLIFYEGLSGIATALIVIYYLRKEKIKGVYPIYSDVKFLLNRIKKGMESH